MGHAWWLFVATGLAAQLALSLEVCFGDEGPRKAGNQWIDSGGKILEVGPPESGVHVVLVGEQHSDLTLKEVAQPPVPRVYHEFHGTSWLIETQPTLLHKRYWVFQDQFGICIVDHQEARMLVNHVLEPVVHDESRLTWVAMKPRSIARHAESLPEGFRDRLTVILLGDRPELPAAEGAEPVRTIELPGLAFSKPVLNPAGDKAVVVVGTEEAVAAVVVNLADGEIVATHPLPHRITGEQLLALQFQDLHTASATELAASLR